MKIPYIQHSLSVEDIAFMKKLESIDFQPIAYRLMHPKEGLEWTQEQTDYAILHYRMFLFLNYLYPDKQLVPSKEVDQVWHYHITDTQKYAEDCNVLFRRFIHHFPYFGLRDEKDREKLEEAFAQTQALFEKHFRINKRNLGGAVSCVCLD